jgi:hypothetical protein
MNMFVSSIDFVSIATILGLSFETVQCGILFCISFDCIPEQIITMMQNTDICGRFSKIIL